jgi:tripeptide aminopeptidase
MSFSRSVVRFGAGALACLSLLVAVPSAQPAAAVRRLVEGEPFQTARAFVRGDHERFVRELIALTEIPAPPFGEARRAKAFLRELAASGLANVEMDAEGNVMGLRRGTGGGGLLVVAAHLDTVFPEETDVRVTRSGTRLAAPGIGDNTRGLALMLSVIRALDAGSFRTPADILFVGNVGEEGEGDLRGVKYLLREGKYKNRITRFLAIDGGHQGTITRGAVGSRRYKVVFAGPGGHSYGAFGLVNPAYAMAAAIARFSDTAVPATPRTTFNVGVLSGGTSVNSIPAEVSMTVDLRSEACAELKKLESTFLSIVKQAADEENRARSTAEGRVVARPELIGDRPCGETPVSAPIVRTAASVVEAFGLSPSFAFSSTDSNIPMSMGIPALTIGRGGPGGRSHAPDEWTDVDPGAVAQSIEIALATILAIAGAP